MKEKYFRPEGRRGRQPIVEATDSVINLLGQPRVDYDKLDSFFREGGLEEPIDSAIIPTIRLFGESKWGLPSFHVPYTKIIFINAVRSEAKSPHRLTEQLMHQGQHLSDSVNHKIRTGFDLAAYPTTVPIFVPVADQLITSIENTIREVTTIIDNPFFQIGLRALPPVLAAGYYYKYLDGREQRAKSATFDEEVFERYKETIIFPDSPKRKRG